MDYFFNFEKMAYLKGHRPDACILCLLRERSSEVDDLTVYRNENMAVSLNLYPYNPGHLLVFPLRHIIDIREMKGDERASFDRVIDRSLQVLDAEYKPSGYNIGCNMGLCAGASIEHLHMHIIPRFAREIGIAELIAGKRVLVENPLDTRKRLEEAFNTMFPSQEE